MENISGITAFLGWCTLINISLYVFSAVLLTVFSKPVKSIHSRIAKIPPDELAVPYFNFLGNYKIAIFVANLAPYLALRLMGA